MGFVREDHVILAVHVDAMREFNVGALRRAAVAAEQLEAVARHGGDPVTLQDQFADAVMRAVDHQQVAVFIQSHSERQVQVGFPRQFRIAVVILLAGAH